MDLPASSRIQLEINNNIYIINIAIVDYAIWHWQYIMSRLTLHYSKLPEITNNTFYIYTIIDTIWHTINIHRPYWPLPFWSNFPQLPTISSGAFNSFISSCACWAFKRHSSVSAWKGVIVAKDRWTSGPWPGLSHDTSWNHTTNEKSLGIQTPSQRVLESWMGRLLIIYPRCMFGWWAL